MDNKKTQSGFLNSAIKMAIVMPLVFLLTLGLTATIFFLIEKDKPALSLVIGQNSYDLKSRDDLIAVVESIYPQQFSVDIVDENRNVLYKRTLKLEDIQGSYISESLIRETERFNKKHILSFFSQSVEKDHGKMEIIFSGERIYYDESLLQQWIEKELQNINHKQTEPFLRVSENQVTFIEGENGIQVDPEDCQKVIGRALRLGNMDNIRIHATVDYTDQDKNQQFIGFDRIIGRVDEKITGEEETRRHIFLLCEHMNATVISPKEKFYFSDLFSSTQGERLYFEVMETGNTAVEQVLSLLYRGAVSAGMKDPAYWNENIAVGDSVHIGKLSTGLSFENNYSQDIMLSLWEDREMLHFAIISKSITE